MGFSLRGAISGASRGLNQIVGAGGSLNPINRAKSLYGHAASGDINGLGADAADAASGGTYGAIRDHFAAGASNAPAAGQGPGMDGQPKSMMSMYRPQSAGGSALAANDPMQRLKGPAATGPAYTAGGSVFSGIGDYNGVRPQSKQQMGQVAGQVGRMIGGMG